ncbi:hypothetical protein SeMB42_g02079 [Synchytrium endobioticum]|uniref:Mitochondrial mRNA-processing protein COX24 C-terminal domain-containing protein n=1 Tax=Synchytrium endobioticum TaxID=286115 RepID=A0A507DI12_9FUNG|nr:hypothetical protein SeLEV6574_g05553 [Synchytrium endobioticum]TPX50955.1 hypothetical protein SeMB42_g02079 [Synchytrium endobioticum]
MTYLAKRAQTTCTRNMAHLSSLCAARKLIGSKPSSATAAETPPSVSRPVIYRTYDGGQCQMNVDAGTRIPFPGFEALTGYQYIKPLLAHTVSRLPDRMHVKPSALSHAIVSLSHTSPPSSASTSEPLSPDELADMVLAGSPSFDWDAFIQQLVPEVMSVRIQADINSAAREALSGIDAKSPSEKSRITAAAASGRGPRIYAISLIKRRRKKMNKHKFEKRKEQNRGTMRANKEALRKRGQDRQKQV